jgi:hypothetical protein
VSSESVTLGRKERRDLIAAASGSTQFEVVLNAASTASELRPKICLKFPVMENISYDFVIV